MKLKKLGLALVVLCALGVVMASQASANAVQTAAPWIVGGKFINEPKAVTTRGAVLLKTTVGATNVPLEMEFGKVECEECSIFNTGLTAEGSGYLRFTEAKVLTPGHCKVSNNALKSAWLRINADFQIGSTTYYRFVPAETTHLWALKLETDGTGLCALSGTYSASGVIYAKATNPRKTYAQTQPLAFSQQINEEASGLTEPLHFGNGNPAQLVGNVSFEAGGRLFGVE